MTRKGAHIAHRFSQKTGSHFFARCALFAAASLFAKNRFPLFCAML
jgi:hypothetical protein